MSDKRKLTPFLAHEMLFDYVTDQLDAHRRRAVEEILETDRESQNLLDAIRRGLAYAETLQTVKIKDEVLRDLEQAESLRSVLHRLRRWSEWPDSLRWSILALMISICTAGVIVLVPWKSVPLFRADPSQQSSSVEIARVETRRGEAENETNEVTVAQNTETGVEGETSHDSSGDEEFAEESSGSEHGAVAQNSHPPSSPPVAAAAKAPVAPAPQAPPAAPAASRVEPPAAPAAASAAKASRGFVYRAFMTLTDLENIAPKITQQMKELGAEKAGEVELGWRRGTGRYYHFSLPDSNEQKLMETLRVYGPVRISKDPHPRVMPEGQVRFILWIESGR